MMLATIARDIQSMDISAFERDELVLVMSQTEFEKQINNAKYLEKLDYIMKYGKSVEHELIELDDDEEEDVEVENEDTVA